jgi:SCP-2 sterol transfer family
MNTEKIVLPRPGNDIMPETFFKEWLPPVIQDFKEMIVENAGDEKGTLSVCVNGDNGGGWSVVLENGDVKIVDSLRDDATVTLTVNEQDFINSVTGKNDDLLPWQGGLSEEIDPSLIGSKLKEAINSLSDIKGALLFRAEDKESPFHVLVNFQGKYKTKPDSTVTIKQEDLRNMSLEGSNIMNMFMSGKIKVDGMMDMVLKFSPLFM